jgi:hypothetical protein
MRVSRRQINDLKNVSLLSYADECGILPPVDAAASSKACSRRVPIKFAFVCSFVECEALGLTAVASF